MAAGGDHPVVRSHPAQHRNRFNGVRPDRHRRGLQRVLGRIDHPHTAAPISPALHRPQRQLQRALATGRGEYARALAQFDLGQCFRGEADAGGIRTPLCIGGRGDLTDRAGQQLARAVPQFHLHRLAHLVITDVAFRQGDHDFAAAIGGQGEHGLPGADHLPGFGLAARDHAIGGRTQLGVLGLVTGPGQIGAGGIGLALRRLEGSGLAVECGLADQLLFGQRGVALLVIAGADQIGFGGRELRLRGTGLGGVVGGVQLGQQLALAHALAGIDMALDQVAPDAERQWAFLAGADLTGIGSHFLAGHGARVDHQHRHRRDRLGVLLATCCQRDRQQPTTHPSHVVHEVLDLKSNPGKAAGDTLFQPLQY